VSSVRQWYAPDKAASGQDVTREKPRKLDGAEEGSVARTGGVVDSDERAGKTSRRVEGYELKSGRVAEWK
jgi:hypothetical protein